jgi:hypothetical protein
MRFGLWGVAYVVVKPRKTPILNVEFQTIVSSSMGGKFSDASVVLRAPITIR